MKRRQIEGQLMVSADKCSPNYRVWCLVSNKWLYNWKCFIQNRVTLNHVFDNKSWAKHINKSENLDVGILPPGPITN